jgi:hypothetical protein
MRGKNLRYYEENIYNELLPIDWAILRFGMLNCGLKDYYLLPKFDHRPEVNGGPKWN